MNQFVKRSMQAAILTATALFAATTIAYVSPRGEEESLRRGAVEDTTPSQRYQTAIREAGGAYKEALRECTQLGGADRRACVREAKATYDRDMFQARMILR